MNAEANAALTLTPRSEKDALKNEPDMEVKASPTLADADSESFVAGALEDLVNCHIPFLLRLCGNDWRLRMTGASFWFHEVVVLILIARRML